MQKVLIVGSTYLNKGAQSMLFTVVDEVKKRWPKSQVYFGCNGETYDEQHYKFIKLYYTKISQDIVLGWCVRNGFRLIKCYAINLMRFILGRSDEILRMHDARNLIPDVDLIIDVSGYCLFDDNVPIEIEYYLDSIRIAKKYGIPMILMPQSFGPLTRLFENKKRTSEIRGLLQYCDVIFAREKSGYDLMCNKLGLENVQESVDLVLQSKELNWDNIFSESYTLKTPNATKGKKVALIPNYHCFDTQDEKRVYELFGKIVEKLINEDREVFIVGFTTLDFEVCRRIAGIFEDDRRVHLVEEEMDCIEYCEFITGFDFIISSRYHACVNAYKGGIPCFMLGWAEKYRELAALFDQSDYVFDLSVSVCDYSDIIISLDRFVERYNEEKKVISGRINSIWANSCFDVLSKY